MPTKKLWDYMIEVKERFDWEKEKYICYQEKRGTQVHWRTAEKGIYQTLEVASNSTSIFCMEKK